MSQDIQAPTSLTSDLAALRIDREPGSRGSRLRRLALVPLFTISAATFFYFARGRFVAYDVETIRPTVRRSTAAWARPILTASGYLVARRKAVVSAKIQGRLAELNVDEGSWVKAGQVIARLDSSDLQAQIDVARAAVGEAAADLTEKQRQFRLTESLANNGLVSRDQLQAAESRVRMAEATLTHNKASLSLAEVNFQNTVIHAPFDGVVVKKMAEVGESVAPIPPGVNLSTSSGAIVARADLSTLEAEADISESNIAKLVRYQSAQVSVDAIPEHAYRAVLRQVIPTADRTKATIAVKVRLLEKDEHLRPEMSAKLTFLEVARARSPSLKPVVTIPKDALVTRDGTTAVFVVDRQKRVHLVSVSIGGQSEDGVIVDQGLVGTEVVVLRPPVALKEGDAVKPRTEDPNA